MTRCNLLNIARVKQIVPRSQIWSYGSSVSQLVQSSYPLAQSSPQGQTAEESGIISSRTWPAILSSGLKPRDPIMGYIVIASDRMKGRELQQQLFNIFK